MDEQTATVNTRYRRKPFVGVILSLLQPGLGHIYCGRITKGFVIACVFSVFLPLIYMNLVVCESRIRIEIIILSILIAVSMLIAVAIDSYRTARKIRPDYELKDYNRWYIYLIFLLLVKANSERVTEDFITNYIEAFRGSSTSMFPTIEVKERFLANKIAYKDVNPKRGDVIVFMCPENRQQIYTKRVVAVAGDTVKMDGNDLYVNGEKLERKSVGRACYIHNYSEKTASKVEGELFIEKNGQVEYKIFLGAVFDSGIYPNRWSDFPELIVPKNHFFVLGDNRNFSEDSRHFGPVPLATVKGKADYLYWPGNDWSRFGRIK